MKNTYTTCMRCLRGTLQHISKFLRISAFYFPGLFCILLIYFLFTAIPQGQDIIVVSMESPLGLVFTYLSVIVWSTITWYSSHIVVIYKKHQRSKKAGRQRGISKMELLHPNLLGFLCFTVIEIAYLNSPLSHHFYRDDFLINTAYTTTISIAVLLVNIVIFRQLTNNPNNSTNGKNITKHLLVLAAMFAFLFIIQLVVGYYPFLNSVVIYIIPLIYITTSFSFLKVIAFSSRPITSQANKKHKNKFREYKKPRTNYPKSQYTPPNSNSNIFYASKVTKRKEITPPPKSQKNILYYLNLVVNNWEKILGIDFDKNGSKERVFSIYFHLTSLLSLILFIAGTFFISFTRFLGPYTIALLSISILLGFWNIISLLSIKYRINFHVLILTWILISGSCFNDTYEIDKTAESTTAEHLNKRPSLSKYFENWFESHKDQIDTSKQYPLFFVVSDGGASRSSYWVGSVLGKIQDTIYKIPESILLNDHIFCMSSTSGGTVGNATYLNALAFNNKILKSKKSHEYFTQYLEEDFFTPALTRMLGTDIYRYIVPFDFLDDRASMLEYSLENPSKGDTLLGKGFKKHLSEVILHSDRLPVFFFNTTRAEDGRPGIITNINWDSSTHFNDRIDIIDQLKPGNIYNNQKDINFSTAAIISARFPYISPGAKLNGQHFVDGGYFDNSGAGIVHELLLELDEIIESYLKRNDISYTDSLKLEKLSYYVIHISNSQASSKNNNQGNTSTLANDLLIPLQTGINSIFKQTDINNGRLQKYLQHKYPRDKSHWINFSLYTPKEFDEPPYSYNWIMSKSTIKRIDKRLNSKEIQSKMDVVLNLLR